MAAKNASAVLGAQEIAGSFVSPKGLTKKLTGSTAAGMLGGVAGRMVADATLGAEGAPPFGNIGYVAVTATEFAIVKGKTGLMKPSVGTDVIARAPRDQIQAAVLDGGMLKAALIVTFLGGGSWEFEVPKVYRGTAEYVVQVLSSPR
jgi:hypothetical protein